MADKLNPAHAIEADRPPPRKRWIPLSLRMLVMILLLAGVSSALWWGVPAWRQLAAVREIEGRGGSVSIEPRGPLWFYGWMYRLTGGRKTMLFEKVVTVDLQKKQATNSTFGKLAVWPAPRRFGSNLLGSEIRASRI